MDSSDIDIDRIERCCYHNASPLGIMSFCVMNNRHRGDAIPESAFVPLVRIA